MSSTAPPSSTTSATAKSHNIATFAGAVGGSIGLLSLLAFSLAFSIYRRRQKSKRRDQQTRAARRGGDAASLSDSFHTDASEDGPPMQGPAPFVPRYFPGTVPAAPPAYTASSSSNNISDVTTSLLTPVTSPHTSVAWPIPRPSDSSNDHSYADRPPPTPPPGDDGYFAPPTFQVAISTPVPAILARFSNLTSSQASQSAGHSSFRLPFSLPSRRQSQSSLAARSHHRSSSNTPQLSRSNSTRSSLRRASASTQPLLSRPISREESEPISRHSLVPSRPPSSASETPPSIAPPAEVLEAEREREAEGPRTRYTGDSAV